MRRNVSEAPLALVAPSSWMRRPVVPVPGETRGKLIVSRLVRVLRGVQYVLK